ncbi:hypothetical protein LINGRAHAP2_LOCUS32959, partial [Linum grandiflorum]
DSLIAQDVVKDIAKKQNWDWGGIQVSKLVTSKVRLGSSRRYEFRFRLGKSYLLFKFPDEFDNGTRITGDDDAFRDLVHQAASPPLLTTLNLQGPFDLWVAGVGQLSLSLPKNITHSDLKHVVVGEGITVEVTGAQEVSLFQALDFGFVGNGSIIRNKGRNGFRDFFYPLCKPLVPIRVIGSASLKAFKTKKPGDSIKTVFLSENVIKLLPEKCYSRNGYRAKARPIQSLDLRIAKLERVFSTYLGERIRNDGLWGFIRATLKASSLIRFQLELEKTPENNNNNNKTHDTEWRTKPSVEHLWFEVTARAEDEKLKPILVKKVRPFISVDTASWSNLMSNISFTKFPSILVPPEALTLDVKW